MRNAIKSKVQTKCYVNWKKKSHQEYSITLNFLGQSKRFGVTNIKHHN